ncbi:hypothetical protein MRX96_007295 [Rhipicephalus microplus]
MRLINVETNKAARRPTLDALVSMGLLLAVGLFGALALRVCQDPDDPTVAEARRLLRQIDAYEALVENVRSCYCAQTTVPSALDDVPDLTDDVDERADRNLVSQIAAQLTTSQRRSSAGQYA